ncbi:MAG: PLP-dependent aspartate aminotransferase family protein, partial [Burkholderiaceae bacterium]
TEAPGSLTFEMQDIPAIAAEAHAAGAVVLMDNTWATPLYFRAFEHGVDVSIQAATKYIVGHSDAMLGLVTTRQAHAAAMERCVHVYGQITSPDDAYVALRGLRTLHVRLERHWASGLKLARWLAEQEEVAEVVHPALPGDKGHELWKRDFLGASGLFCFSFKKLPPHAFEAFIDQLGLFHIGASWGGFESLVQPINPGSQRTATTWAPAGNSVRIHVGLEDADDLIDDLSGAFKKLRSFG